MAWVSGRVEEEMALEEEVERAKSWPSETEREERAPVGRQAVQPLLVLGFLRSLKYASYF